MDCKIGSAVLCAAVGQAGLREAAFERHAEGRGGGGRWLTAAAVG